MAARPGGNNGDTIGQQTSGFRISATISRLSLGLANDRAPRSHRQLFHGGAQRRGMYQFAQQTFDCITEYANTIFHYHITQPCSTTTQLDHSLPVTTFCRPLLIVSATARSMATPVSRRSCRFPIGSCTPIESTSTSRWWCESTCPSTTWSSLPTATFISSTYVGVLQFSGRRSRGCLLVLRSWFCNWLATALKNTSKRQLISLPFSLLLSA